MKEFLLDVLFLITHPHFLVMIGKYDERVDKFILEAIEKDLFIISEHTKAMKNYRGDFYEPFELAVKDNKAEVWIRNYPYGYGAIMGKRPSRRTVKELKNYLDGRPDLA